MSLSILIPAYNYDCTQLVRALYEQAINLTIDFEIIVADDASTNAATERQNAEIGKMPHCQYIRLKENLGRAAIRNFLAEKAKYDNLMFMDCDGKVVYLHFLSAYMKAIEDHDVVCGGMMHPLDMVLKNNNLRYQYEVRSEKMLKADKVEVINGEAKIVAKDQIECAGRIYEGENIIIASGSVTSIPPIEGIEEAITSDTILEEAFDLPESMIIIGGGVIGSEIADALNGFGCKITIIEMADRLIPTMDKDLGQRLGMFFKKKGIDVFLNAAVKKIEKTASTAA